MEHYFIRTQSLFPYLHSHAMQLKNIEWEWTIKFRIFEVNANILDVNCWLLIVFVCTGELNTLRSTFPSVLSQPQQAIWLTISHCHFSESIQLDSECTSFHESKLQVLVAQCTKNSWTLAFRGAAVSKKELASATQHSHRRSNERTFKIFHSEISFPYATVVWSKSDKTRREEHIQIAIPLDKSCGGGTRERSRTKHHNKMRNSFCNENWEIQIDVAPFYSHEYCLRSTV